MDVSALQATVLGIEARIISDFAIDVDILLPPFLLLNISMRSYAEILVGVGRIRIRRHGVIV